MSAGALIEEGPSEGGRHPATVGAVIGREECEIVVPDPEVSRRHAAVRSTDGGVGIEDLGSRNGTFVNEKRIEGVRPLTSGDRIRVGDTTLRFELPASAQGVAAPEGARGDVPAPEVVPSVVRRAPPVAASEPPAFDRARQRKVRGGGSAARRAEATIISYAVVLATAVAVVAYFATR